MSQSENNFIDIIHSEDIKQFNKIEICYISRIISDFAYDYGFNYDCNFIHLTTSLLEFPPFIQKCKYYTHINGQLEAIENISNNSPEIHNNYDFYFHTNNYLSIKKVDNNIIKFIDNSKMHILHGIELNDKFKYIIEGSNNIYETTRYRWKWTNSAGIDVYYFDIILYPDLSNNSTMKMKFISTINIYEKKDITPENIKIILENYEKINKLTFINLHSR